MKGEDNRVIRASEVGFYVYCTRAWWLGRVQGYRPLNQDALEAGEAAHQAHGRAVVGYHRLRRAAYALLWLALLTGGLLLIAVLLRQVPR